MKKISIFEKSEQITDEQISISKYRIDTLSRLLENYQDLKHVKRNSTVKSDVNYLENKITGILKKINKFVSEFGLEFLKDKLKEYYDTNSFSVVLDEAIQYLTESEKTSKKKSVNESAEEFSIPSYSPEIPTNVKTFPDSDITGVIIYIDTNKLSSVNENKNDIESVAIDMQLKTDIEQPLEFFYEVVDKLLKSNYNNEEQSEINEVINGIEICFNPIGDHIFVELGGTDNVYQISKLKLDELKSSVTESSKINAGDTITLINKKFGKINANVEKIDGDILYYQIPTQKIQGTVDMKIIKPQPIYSVSESLLHI